MTRSRAKQPDIPNRPEETQGEVSSPGIMTGQAVFWRHELPRLGLDFNLRALYAPVSLCPICQGSRSYWSEEANREVACFCQLQDLYQKRIDRWREYDFLPEHYRSIQREDLLAFDRIFTPTQRAQFSVLLKDIDSFVEDPQRNRIFVGGVGSHCSMLAAYIAGHLDGLPNIFITLRQLVSLLCDPETADARHLCRLFFLIPVLIIDDFSGAYGEIDEMMAQRLYDLVQYRWSEGLPIVVVSDVEFDKLWAIHPLLLERLQQDAETCIFDPQQIKLQRPVSRSTGRLDPSRIPVHVHRCPWLGTNDGLKTDYAFPMPDHCCLRTVTPQPIILAYQGGTCLSAEHVTCPVFQTPEGQSIEALPGDILREEKPQVYPSPPIQIQPAILLAAVGVILAMVIGGLVVFSEMSQTAPPMSTSRAIATGIPTMISSSTPAPAATSTPATVALTPTMIPMAEQETSLVQETRLRIRPDAQAPALALLPVDTSLVVLGRDVFGGWLYVKVRDDLAGWVDVDTIAEGIDVMALPVYGEGTSTPEATPTDISSNLVVAFATMSPTPGIPDSFTISLSYIDISTCGYPDLTANYRFLLAGTRITMIRSMDSTVFTGSYTPDTGVFTASATHSAAIEEISGRIVFSGRLLEVKGEHRNTYYEGACPALWMFSGRVLLDGDQ